MSTDQKLFIFFRQRLFDTNEHYLCFYGCPVTQKIFKRFYVAIFGAYNVLYTYMLF